MEIFIYSDESGVLDKAHNDYFVYGGIMFLSKEARDNCSRMFVAAERLTKRALRMPDEIEAKASNIGNKQRAKLFRALNNQIRFGVIVDQRKVLDRIFQSKKDKQRFLDYVYKIAVRRCFEFLIGKHKIEADAACNIHFYVDEHTTATNGKYELREALEQELKNGTYNVTWDKYFEPVFPNANIISLEYCNSSVKPLIRAADIISNKIYYYANKTANFSCFEDDLLVVRLP